MCDAFRHEAGPLCVITAVALVAGAMACSGSDTAPGNEGSAPAVVQIDTASHPAFDENLYKVVCMTGPGATTVAPACPVVRWDGVDYWALAYEDNRSSMAILAYDQTGALLNSVEKTGARYVYAIDVDSTAQSVTFHGQADATITMTWAELGQLR